MAKVYKISAYLVDYNDEFDDDNIEDYLMYYTEDNLNLEHINIESADIGEWYDDHPLNYVDADIKVFESYFKRGDKYEHRKNNK